MASFEIVPGGIYAKADGSFAREVIRITPDGYVFYNDYGLSDGAPIGRQCKCSLGTFIQWAARPLKPEEIARLRCDEGKIRDLERGLAMIELAIATAPDDLIRREFYRRGLDRIAEPDQTKEQGQKTEGDRGVCSLRSDETTKSRSPLFIEALAYHEAGHVVMNLVLDIPLRRAVIADACDLEGYNGLVEMEGAPLVSRLRQALILLASEYSERLSPNFKKFGRLKGFASGRRNDKANAFQIMATAYQLMGFALSTAQQQFRQHTRPPLLAIMGHPKNQEVVHEIADLLIARKSLDRDAILAFKSKVILPEEIKEAVRQK